MHLVKTAGLLLSLFVSCAFDAAAQQSNLSCSQTAVPLVNGLTPSFTVTQSSGTTGSGIWLNTANVVDNNLTNFASGTFTLTSGMLTLAVTDAANDYAAGNFAGFVVESSALSLNVLGSLTINTYLNGTLQETKSAGALLALASGITGAYEVGFYTNTSFDAVELTATSTAGLAGYNVYYAILQGTGSCSSPALSCNASTAPVFPAYAAVVDPEFTGTSGALTLSAVSNRENVVDNSATTFASITTAVGVAGAAFLAVKDVTTDYPAGTYAGFDIENPVLADVNLLSNIAIQTYKDGVFQEAQSGTGLLLGASVLSNGSRQKAGFVTTLVFDEVQLVITQPAAGIGLGTTRVYSAILKKLCAGPALLCNMPTALNESVYPVTIDLSKTGISGAACVACRVDSTGNVIDGDAGTGATISLTAGALSSGSIAVKDALTQYDSGTFAGFDIESTALLNANVLANFTVSTYLAGALQESFSGNTLLAGVSTSLLGTSGRFTVGNTAAQPFDELRLTATQTAGTDLGITKVYGATLTQFCGGTIGCNSTYFLNNTAFPTFIDGRHTGVTGAACAACNVSNTNNAISADTTDYAVLTTVAGVAAATSLSVHDAVATYPAGTLAGFGIAETNNLLQVNLFKTITITTYNNGVLQESRSAGQLLNLSALVLQLNPTAGYYNAGFQATLPFDEVRISAAPVAGVAPVVRVYGAFVDTRFLSGSALGGLCIKAPVAEPDHVSTLIGMPVSGNLKTNDRDPQGQPLTYNTTATTAPLNGTALIGADGTFTYTPNAGFTGVDSFRYTVCNASGICTSEWAFVSVVPVSTPGGSNRAPLAQSDLSETLVNLPVSGDARRNDNDPDGNLLTYTTAVLPTHGTLNLNTNGQYVYTPDSSFIGVDTARINVCDNGNPVLCAISTLTIRVFPDANAAGNDAPFAQDDVVTGPVGSNLTGNVLLNDSDPNGDTLSIAFLEAVPAASGTLYSLPNGSFNFIPATGFTGTVSARYAVCDNGTPSRCDTATLTLTVTPVVGPDFTPLITFDSTTFSTPGAVRDFIITITSLNSNPSNSPIVLKVLKPSAFDITFSSATTSSAVNGSTAVNNGNWTFTQNGLFITCTLNSGATIAGNGQNIIGFSIARKPNISPQTRQNLTTTIVGGSGGDSNNTNNQSTVNLYTN